MLVGGVQFFSQVASEVRACDRHEILNRYESCTFIKEYLTTSNKRKGFFEWNLDEVRSYAFLSKSSVGVVSLLVEADVLLELLPDRIRLSQGFVLDA